MRDPGHTAENVGAQDSTRGLAGSLFPGIGKWGDPRGSGAMLKTIPKSTYTEVLLSVTM